MATTLEQAKEEALKLQEVINILLRDFEKRHEIKVTIRNEELNISDCEKPMSNFILCAKIF